MNASALPLLTVEHLDLLVSAATEWRILTSTTAAAFSRAEAHLVVATAVQAGRLIQQENLAAARWHADAGRGQLPDDITPPPYTYTPVERLSPVEVIKACHCAETSCESAPGWSASVAKRLVTAIIRAATFRLEGYADAPWQWTRPGRRSGPPIAVGGAWRPDLPGATWVGPSQVAQYWADASIVIVTTDVAAHLPATLPRRAGVFLLAEHDPADEVWQAIVAMNDQALVMFWPTCEPWLAEQLAHPAPQFVEHRTSAS